MDVNQTKPCCLKMRKGRFVPIGRMGGLNFFIILVVGIVPQDLLDFNFKDEEGISARAKLMTCTIRFITQFEFLSSHLCVC